MTFDKKGVSKKQDVSRKQDTNAQISNLIKTLGLAVNNCNDKTLENTYIKLKKDFESKKKITPLREQNSILAQYLLKFQEIQNKLKGKEVSTQVEISQGVTSDGDKDTTLPVSIIWNTQETTKNTDAVSETKSNNGSDEGSITIDITPPECASSPKTSDDHIQNEDYATSEEELVYESSDHESDEDESEKEFVYPRSDKEESEEKFVYKSDNQQEDIDGLFAEISSLEADNLKKDKVIADLKQQIEQQHLQMEDQARICTKWRYAYEEVKEKNAQLEGKVTKTEEENAQPMAQVTEAKQKNAQLVKQLDDVKEKNVQLLQQENACQKLIISLQEEVSYLKTQLHMAQSNIYIEYGKSISNTGDSSKPNDLGHGNDDSRQEMPSNHFSELENDALLDTSDEKVKDDTSEQELKNANFSKKIAVIPEMSKKKYDYALSFLEKQHFLVENLYQPLDLENRKIFIEKAKRESEESLNELLSQVILLNNYKTLLLAIYGKNFSYCQYNVYTDELVEGAKKYFDTRMNYIGMGENNTDCTLNEITDVVKEINAIHKKKFYYLEKELIPLEKKFIIYSFDGYKYLYPNEKAWFVAALRNTQEINSSMKGDWWKRYGRVRSLEYALIQKCPEYFTNAMKDNTDWPLLQSLFISLKAEIFFFVGKENKGKEKLIDSEVPIEEIAEKYKIKLNDVTSDDHLKNAFDWLGKIVHFYGENLSR